MDSTRMSVAPNQEGAATNTTAYSLIQTRGSSINLANVVVRVTGQ